MQAVDRVTHVLEALGEHHDGLGVTALSDGLGMPPSTVHRVLAGLKKAGFAQQDPDTRRYRLGPAALRLSQAYLRQDMLIGLARPHLDDLRSATSESAFLSEFIGGQAICVAMAESPRPLRFFMRLGQRMPYHSSASGRAILAFQPEDFARPAAEAELAEAQRSAIPATDHTPSTVEEVLAELARVRQQGYAICDQELELGVTALSAPIRGPDGSVTASVTIVAPTERVTTRRERVAHQICETAAAISHDLGHAPTAASVTL